MNQWKMGYLYFINHPGLIFTLTVRYVGDNLYAVFFLANLTLLFNWSTQTYFLGGVGGLFPIITIHLILNFCDSFL